MLILFSVRISLIAALAVLPAAAQLLEEKSDLAVPLTAQGKAVRAVKIATGVGPVLSSVVGAGFDHLDNYPSEWGQGAKGYGRRVTSIYGRYTIETMMKAGLDVGFKTDPRYDRCNCSGVVPRASHAVRRILLTHKDSGGETPNVPIFAAIFGGAVIANQWMPDRLNTIEDHFAVAGVDLAAATGMNIAREFWPDIKKKLPFLKK